MEPPYKQYFDLMPCYVTVQDRNFRVVTANARFRKDFGDYENRYCYQVYKNRPEKCEVCPVELTFRDGQSHSSEERVRCLDGTEVSVIVYTEPIRDDNGEITGVMEMSTDITDIKRLQHQLRESQNRYHKLFEEVPCYISIQDQDLNVVDANRIHRQDFGSYLGCKCYEVYKHRNEECYPCTVRQTFQDGKVHVHEEVVTSEKGDTLDVLVHTSPIHDAAGNIKYVMEMSANITQIRELESKLTSIGLLISSISHGIKGLLNGLNGGIYLVNNGIANKNQGRLEKGWEIVVRNVTRIRSMVMDILYYAKDREPNWEQLSGEDVLDEVYDVMAARAREMGIEFSKEVSDQTGEFEADKNAIRSMLINLLENSFDACRIDKRKEQHHVALRLKGNSDQVHFEVQDNGIGMERETREKAFSLFFSSKGTEGTGLGLFIAHKIAAAHGGDIHLESELEVGTRFVVDLPRIKPAKALPPASNPSPPNPD
jgi:PAS domain S-box-containing protein